MGGDYTRFTFEPRRDHAGVLMQQGRVQLDADWNEWVEMIDRRLLAETLDLSGRRCGVPRTTPEGFRIDRDTAGRLTIGRGRIYVDGILVENHGTGDAEIEPVWREVRGQDPIDYRDQPYLRPSTPATEPDGNGPHLVYLDVWRREVTAVEEPEMVERALGVDTTTRFQTAWAVRCLEGVERRTRCGTDLSRIPEWVAATRPSGARLTTGPPSVPEEPDPCLIQPTGGYRGIENRLYRVEIHDDGTEAGRPISFKWSRDNASVAATIVGPIADATTKPRLTVNRLGRDAVLKFHDLDWVELTDDQREADGLPGIMARVETADEATSTITLVAPLSELPDMTRNPRVRRWDQTADQVNARGVIPLEPLPTELELEDGVTVRFTQEGADPPHVGDYWVFAARAVDGSVEELDEALPRGVRHHYCPLAVIRGDEVEDCRDIFPEECDDCECTVCVTPESHEDRTLTIQDAVHRVRERGGKICLAPGIYEIRRPVRIQEARGVQLSGKGSRSVIVHEGPGPAIEIEDCYDVTVERLAIASASSGLGALLADREAERTGARRRRVRRARKAPKAPEIGILITKAIGTTIERCVLAQSESLFKGPTPIAYEVRSAETTRMEYTSRGTSPDYIERDRTMGSIGIAFAGIAVETRIRDNVVFAETGVGMAALGRTPAPPIRRAGGTEWTRSAYDASRLYRVNERRMRAKPAESRMVDYAIRSEGSGESATRRAERETNETAALLTNASSITVLPRYLLTMRLLIEDNVFAGARAGVDLTTLAGLGKTTALVIHAGETRIAGNSVYRSRVGVALAGLVPGAGLTGRMSETTSLGAETRFTAGFPARIAAAAGSHVEISENTCAVGSIGILAGCDGARIVGNDLIGTGAYPTSGITLIPAFYGTYSSTYTARSAVFTEYYRMLFGAEVRDNRVSGFGEFGIDSPRYGPLLIDATIAGNRVDSCGVGGIQVTMGFRLTISDNEVRNVGQEADAYAAGIALVRGSNLSRISGNVVAGVGQGVQGLSSCTGIAVGAAIYLRIADNHLSSVAGEALGIPISGIEINQGADRAELVDNTVIGPDEGDTGADWAAVRIESGSPEQADEVTLLIRGNQLEAAGSTACVSVASAPGQASCTLADNRCALVTGSEGVPAAVVELGLWYHLILNSNHVEGSREVLGISGQSELYTVLGNIVNTGIEINGGALGTPWDALNISH